MKINYSYFFPYIRSNCNQWSSLSNKFCDMKSPLTPRTLEIFYQNNGGNGLLDLLAPEVFYQIMVNLELKDIRICMCVCKKWRVSGRVSTNRAFSKVQSKMCSVHFKDFVSFPLKSVVDHSRPSP